jgi:hypothetical protein
MLDTIQHNVRRLLAVALCAVSLNVGCAKDAGLPQTAQAPTRTTPEDSIGVATMEADGTIVLTLRASTPGGIRGETQLRYPRDHEEYDAVLKHLGGLRPGESKPVPPWPDPRGGWPVDAAPAAGRL